MTLPSLSNRNPLPEKAGAPVKTNLKRATIKEKES
jgi:hypothetical protein